MIYFTPGPSQLFPTVNQHILNALEEEIPSLSHRSEKFRGFVKQISFDLKQLLSIPEDYHFFFTTSATEAMERIIENTVAKKSFHFINGTFAKRFHQIAVDLKKQPKKLQPALGQPFDYKQADIDTDTELICFTQNETSSGISVPPEDIYATAAKYPDALIAVDIVSSVPFVSLDYSKLDCVFFSVQKGYGLPAGLGVLIVSPRALKKAQKLMQEGYNVGSYHKFQTLYDEAQKNQTIETPNVLAIYLFHKVLQDMLKIGIKTIRKETEKRASYLYDYFDKAGNKPFVSDKKYRSQTVIVIGTPNGSTALLAKLKELGLIVGAGYGDMKEKQMRIANFPAHTLDNMKELITKIEAINV